MNPTHIPAAYGPAARAKNTAAMLEFSKAELEEAVTQVKAKMALEKNHSKWNNEGLHLWALENAIFRKAASNVTGLESSVVRLSTSE